MRAWPLAGVAVLLAAITFPVPAAAQRKLVVSYIVAGVNSLPFIANKKGYFENNGLDVQLQAMRGTSVMIPSMVADSVQVGTIAASSQIQAVDGGIDLAALGGLSSVNKDTKDSALIARAGTNIKAAKDLVGKKVAVSTIGSYSHVMIGKWLLLNHVDPNSVTFVEAPFSHMPDIMRGTSVDAAHLPEPILGSILKAGTATLVSYLVDSFPDDTISTLSAVTRDWAVKHPTEVRAYRRSIAEAEAFVRNRANEDEVRRIIGDQINLKPEVMAGIPTPRLGASLTVEQLRWWIDTMNEQKLLRTRLDPEKLIFKL
jgi:NitT/TauT family transport system substrate-binding protein